MACGVFSLASLDGRLEPSYKQHGVVDDYVFGVALDVEATVGVPEREERRPRSGMTPAPIP
jgi:hypothetical protein